VTRRAPGEFDTFLFADYSGAGAVASQRAAIALARLDRGRRVPRLIPGPFTRDSLRERLLRELEDATREKRRVLFGVDHQWSWPIDMWRAAGLERLPWRLALEKLVRGGGGTRLPPLGPPFEYASAFNAAVRGDVFHSRVRAVARRYRIPTEERWSGSGIRSTERASRGAKPANRLGGTGAVAGQTLEGLRQLARLVRAADEAVLGVAWWPFEAVLDDGLSHVGCEIYPGACKRALRESGVAWRRAGMNDHEADAAAVCLWASRAPLARLLDLSDLPRQVLRRVRLEGWILGARPSGPRELARTRAASPKRSRS
jgi:hypothetical protein